MCLGCTLGFVGTGLILLCSADGRIRLATLELSCLLLKQQVLTSSGCVIKDVHLACLEVRPCLPLPFLYCHPSAEEISHEVLGTAWSGHP